MSVQSSQKTTTTSYRTVKVASPEPTITTTTVGSGGGGGATLIAAGSTSPVQYSLNGYETVRYLVPVQQGMQQQSYVLMQQPLVQQPVMQQVVSPVYLQGMQNLSIDSDLLYQQQAAVSSHLGRSTGGQMKGGFCCVMVGRREHSVGIRCSPPPTTPTPGLL